MIKITTAPVSEPIEVDYVKTYLHWIDTDDSLDAIISDYIAAAREEIEKQANLSLVSKTYSQWIYPENMQDYEIDLLRPPHHTIDKVVSIAGDGTETELTEGDGYTLEKGKTYRIRFDAVGFHRVDFKSGYGSDYGQDLPALLKIAIAEQVGQWFEGELDVGVLSDNVMAKIGRFSENTLI